MGVRGHVKKNNVVVPKGRAFWHALALRGRQIYKGIIISF